MTMKNHNHRRGASLLFAVLLSCILLSSAVGQINFNSSGLSGENLQNPTSLQFGPDNRLYVSQQNGMIYAYTIQKNGPNNYAVTNTESIALIKNMPNHNDDGTINNSLNARQITGILVTGTASNPVLFVTSSDPRIGGGGSAGDNNLDTNSGVISKLTRNGSNWMKQDVVIGLPRSEENHSSNGMQLDKVNNIMYLAQGGNTNAGAPSNNFAFLTEYALSAAILKIDLDQINSEFGGTYILPTLDDPTRPNSGPGGTDSYDPYGGNDGLNQAKLVPGGPVQIHSPGYRNAYDIVLMKSPGKEGFLYTIDNGPNGGWGGHPAQEGTFGNPLNTNVTNNYVVGEPGSNGPGPNDAKVNNMDNLHLVSKPGMTPIYAGHPCPIRANPSSAGLYRYDNATGTPYYTLNPTPDWPPVPSSMANPVEGDFRNPGINDGALWVVSASTNGIAEYTSGNYFNGAMVGNLLAASFNGNIYRISLSVDGTSTTNVESMASGFGATPLDVTAQGPGEIFEGTVWAATYGSNNITIFEPESAGNCTGDNSNDQLDDDGDGFSNYDETLNGTNPCSASSKPDDNDGDFLSDKYDPDDDNDGISDFTDYFPIDQFNGQNTHLPVLYPFLNGDPGFGLFGMGFTGLMNNGSADYLDLFPDDPGLIMGGAVGIASVPAAAGDPVTNNGLYNFQFGIDVDQNTGSFTVESRLQGDPFFDGISINQLKNQTQGIFIGVGNQKDYLKICLTGNNGNPGFLVLREENGVVVLNQLFPVANILNAGIIDLQFVIDPATANVAIRYSTPALGVFQSIGNTVTLSGALKSTLQGPEGLAVGLISSSGTSGTAFSASWDYMNVTTAAPYVANNVPSYNASINTGPLQVDLNYIFEDDGGDGNLTYSVVSITNQSLITGSTINNDILALSFGVDKTGSSVVTVKATDADNNSGLYVFNVIVQGARTVLHRINSGGSQYTYQDRVWSADAYFNGGSTYSITQGISNTLEDPIYQSERFGNVTYQFPVPEAGDYEVILHFAEIYHGVANSNGAGTRIFNINIENGAAQITNYDILNETGSPLTAVTASVPPVTVNDGNLTVQFTTVLENAKVSGIEVYKIGAAPSSLPPIVQNPGNQEIAEGGSLALQIQASDPENDDLTYSATGLPASLSINPQSGLISGTVEVSSGIYPVSVSATDNNNPPVTVSFNITVTAGSQPFALRINPGGPQISHNALTWQADQYFSGGNTYSKITPIAGTTNDVLYQTERWGNFTYSIPVSGPGLYDVTLYFAEIYHGAGAIGSRVFNVSVENGQGGLTNYDIIADVGAATAVAKTFSAIEVVDGVLNIAFTSIVDNAKISGISITGQSQSNGPPVLTALGPKSVVEGSNLDIVLSAIDPENDAMSFSISPENIDFISLIDNGNGTGVVTVSPLQGDAGIYNLTITVTDAKNNIDFETIPITVVAAVNNPPVLADIGPVSLMEGNTLNIPLSASDPENDGLIFAISPNNIPFIALTDNGNSSGSITLTPVLGDAGNYNLTVSVTDNQGNTDNEVVSIVIVPGGPPSSFALRINSGGGAYTFGGNEWLADQYFTGGKKYVTGIPIANTSNDQLYQSERYGNLSYQIPVPEQGNYTVILHFAEIWHGVSNTKGVGARIFNVKIENNQAGLTNYDIIADVGTSAASIKTFNNINVSDGFVTITLTKVFENAKISGIEVMGNGGSNARTEGSIVEAVTQANKVSIEIFPNPAQDVINLSYSVHRNIETDVVLSDMVGRFVSIGRILLREGANTIDLEIDRDRFRNGLYIMSFNNPLLKDQKIKVVLK